MNETTKKLMEWAINKIKTDFPNDVALLIGIEGHSVDGDGHGECFDYFVPANEKGLELSQTFIIDGIGYDLYPRSWERMERTANLDDTKTLCLSNSKILYSRCKDDENRFIALRKKLFDNLSNDEFTYKKALENLNIAMDLYRTMMFEDKLYKVKMAAGFIADYLSMAVTYLNKTYEEDWRDGKIPHLRKLTALPNNFIEYYKAIVYAESENELKNLAHLIISSTRQFITKYKSTNNNLTNNVDFLGLANWYEEVSLWWRRIYYYCSEKNSDAVFVDACNLQNELNIVKEEFNLKEMDLLGYFNAVDLNILISRAKELEDYIVAEIETHGASIRNFKNLESFLLAK